MNSLILFLIAYPGFAFITLIVPMLAFRWFTSPKHRKHTEWLLVCALFIEPAGMLCQFTANCLSRLEPMKYDLYVYQIDRALGLGRFVFGGWVDHSTALKILVSVSYGLLPAMMFVAFAVNLIWDSEKSALQAAKTIASNLFLALPLYLLFPVCGPQFAFPTFPHVPVGIEAARIAINAAPNGVPSVHTSTALLILWFLRRSWAGRITGLIFLALTVFATLGSGQHYVFDLLCALPYAAGVLYLCGELQAAPIAVLTEQAA